MRGMQVEGAHILVVDDDPALRETVIDLLDDYGFTARGAANGRELFGQLADWSCQLIVLDLKLPGEDGLSLLQRLRLEHRHLPVIMLTSLGSDVDRIIGLEMGADDYLAKPFNPRELVARIKAVLRRGGVQEPPPATPAAEQTGSDGRPARAVARFADWRLDTATRELTSPQGERVDLTPGEYNLLEALARAPQRILSRDQLLDMTHTLETEVFDRTIDVLILRLRRKIEPDPKHPTLIRTERNAGYIFTPRVEWR